ncbi:C39 family peptidase [Candidatus Dependentiae bacterium]|nr:C39 family peptidase [Candidatus Dependentiae bacterium]
MKAIMVGCVVLGLGSIISAQPDTREWTWNYVKRFNAHERKNHALLPHLVFAKAGIAPFSQLVFSWNAVRPSHGHFSFLVQVRNNKTGVWGSWHKMFDWGASIQRSYYSASDGCAHYVHVRLEVDKTQLADAFRIKIEAHDGAHLSSVRCCTVNVSDLTHFATEVNNSFSHLSSVYVAHVPRLSQMVLNHVRASELCSPTSSSMVASYISDRGIDPVEFAQRSFDSGLNTYGSWPFNMACAYEYGNDYAHFFTTRCSSFSALHHYLERSIPVAVSVRGTLEGAPKSYPKGHLLVVVGYDAQSNEVICHDPACASHDATQMRYQLQDFLKAWERSRRLAYVAERIV